MISLCPSARVNIFRPSHAACALAEYLECSHLTASVLESRNMTADSVEDLRAALAQPLEALLEPVRLGRNAADTAKRWKATENLGNVLVYGDYDVDGVSSTTLALELCRTKATSARFFIPHRDEQGYGLHESVLEELLPHGWDTLIVTDCGSKDTHILQRAVDAGLNVFVFDHHLPEGGEPFHPTVVNPHDGAGCDVGKSLSATTVLWAWAWIYDIVAKEDLRRALDLAALATLADCMPLTALNRSFVRHGLALLNRAPKPGLEALFRKLGMTPGTLTEETLTMRVIPCLNAAGRMDFADTAVAVLRNGREQEEQVDNLILLNKKRQALSGRISEEASLLLRDSPFNHVALGETWPVGVLSSVASRLCNQLSTPVVLAAPVRGGIRGTLRVPEGGDAMEILNPIASRLDAWGGHRFAAGFSVSRNNWDGVALYLEKSLAAVEVEEPLLDALERLPGDITLKEWKELQLLGPFGNGNPSPLFYAPADGAWGLLPLGKTGRHVQIEMDGSRILAFDGEKLREWFDKARGILYRPRIDTWRGVERLQYLVEYIVV